MRLNRLRRAQLADENKRWGATLQPIPKDEWPLLRPGMTMPTQALRSREFLVQIFDEPSGLRMTVNRAELARGSATAWREDISWDDLQRLKREAGYGDRWAVECYPADAEVVNVANMRHLWLLPDPPAFGWKRMKHEWFRPDFIGYDCCRMCGIVRRADDKNGPCRGPTRVELRADQP